MKLGLYPGCSLEGSAREYGESLRAIAPHLGLELTEMSGWGCCGASAAHALDHDLAVSLPADILARAERQHLQDLLVPCAACYNRLATTRHAMEAQAAMHTAAAGDAALPGATTRLYDILQVLSTVLTTDVLAHMPATFPYKVVCYYGCLLVRPPKVLAPPRAEDPMVMDDIVKRLGAVPLPWGMKTECCGAGLSVTRTDVVGELCGRIVSDATARGAQAIIVACPMCHSNLDMRRPQSEHAMGQTSTMPVLYVTQAVGLALGIAPERLGLQRHFVHVDLRGKAKVQSAERTRAGVPA